MKGTIYLKVLFLLLFFIACSSAEHKRNARLSEQMDRYFDRHYSQFENKDYIEQLKVMGISYLQSDLTSTWRPRPRSVQYLQDLIKSLRSKNDILFNKDQKIDLIFIRDAKPFYFSLPEGKIFMSIGLLRKYVEHEQLLVCILAGELIRLEKSLYKKSLIIPASPLSSDRILSLVRLPLEDRMIINKWIYYIVGRAGFEGAQILSWIQVQNKNILDFLPLLGDVKSISREESQLKAYIVKKMRGEEQHLQRNSSPLFYAFMEELKQVRMK